MMNIVRVLSGPYFTMPYDCTVARGGRRGGVGWGGAGGHRSGVVPSAPGSLLILPSS